MDGTRAATEHSGETIATTSARQDYLRRHIPCRENSSPVQMCRIKGSWSPRRSSCYRALLMEGSRSAGHTSHPLRWWAVRLGLALALLLPALGHYAALAAPEPPPASMTMTQHGPGHGFTCERTPTSAGVTTSRSSRPSCEGLASDVPAESGPVGAGALAIAGVAPAPADHSPLFGRHLLTALGVARS